MDPKNKRTPVPAGGQPIPAAVAAADATPAAGSAETATTPPTSEEGADGKATERKDDGEVVEAAVLVAFGDHQVDEIISASATEIEQLKLAGTVDPHPDAIAFVRSLEA